MRWGGGDHLAPTFEPPGNLSGTETCSGEAMEGQVDRLKTIRRPMYSRAAVYLLTAQIINTDRICYGPRGG